MELVHHAANRGHGFPAGSLSALRACLEAGAEIVEIDITPIKAAADFALLHDGLLDEQTSGCGPVAERTAGEIIHLRYLWPKGEVSAEPVGLLSQAVVMVQQYRGLQELQLDLKPHSYLTRAGVSRLLGLIAPIRERVRITSGADWHLRQIAREDSRLSLGFDPLFYLDLDDDESEVERLPFRVGAYGYRDDHPLSARRWGAPADYLAARAEALLAQAPCCDVWYIRAQLLARVLSEGFDWVAYLHERGIKVDVWTLDASRSGDVALAQSLISKGVDRITTNEAPAMAAALS